MVYEKRLVPPLKLSVLMPVYNERLLVRRCVERVLAFSDPCVREVELIVVDDASTDGTQEILRELAQQHARMHYLERERNGGKGAAIRQALRTATGELSVIQDADLEYDPTDWSVMLRAFVEADADVVYGSRFAASPYRRVLYYWHTLGNRLLTTLSNLATDLNLTDMETCYKMARTDLLKSIPVRSNDFSMEPEITAKLAKRRAVVYEVPIRYAGRTYAEGKKISARHGFGALWAIMKWKVIDDIYQDDECFADLLQSLTHTPEIHRWMADAIAPHVGARVLEVGAGIGNLSKQLIPREDYLATDIHPLHVSYLYNLSLGKPYFHTAELNLLDEQGFAQLRGRFDTVVCLNVLEHVADEARALRNMYTALQPGGKAIVLVPQGQWLYTTLDEALDHVKRYSKQQLVDAMESTGFRVRSVYDFNRFSVPGWALNGHMLRRKYWSSMQLKMANTVTPLLKRLDSLFPWHGLSVVAVGQK